MYTDPGRRCQVPPMSYQCHNKRGRVERPLDEAKRLHEESKKEFNESCRHEKKKMRSDRFNVFLYLFLVIEKMICILIKDSKIIRRLLN
jgi:hypothetical protein